MRRLGDGTGYPGGGTGPRPRAPGGEAAGIDAEGGIGGGVAVARRLFFAPKYLHLSLDANLILGLIGLLMLTALFGAAFRIVECACSETTALARLGRDQGGHPAGDRGEKLYFEVRARFQQIAYPFLTLDTDRGTHETLQELLAYLDRQE